MKPEIIRRQTPTTKSRPPENEVPGTSSISGAVLNVSTSSKTGAGFNVFHLRRRIPWFLVILVMAFEVNVRVVFLLRLALRICVMISTIGALIICLIIIVNSEGSLFGPLVDGLKFELHTLPVDGRAVPDGDGLTVYVSASDPRESSRVPHEVMMAFVERQGARGGRNHTKSDALKKQIIDAGYNVLYINKKEILARKYRIRLRGIDAPENAMPYGKEAKNELVKIVEGKCLRILIFDEDPYGRFIGDVYYNHRFVQKIMLKKGLAWHYTAYDKRPELAKWEKDAKEKRIGLWALENPEMPWKWRKNHPQSRY